MSNLAVIEAQALQLSFEDREALVDKLNQSLHNQGMTEAEKAWMPIIQERYRQCMTGEMELLTLEETMEFVRKEID